MALGLYVQYSLAGLPNFGHVAFMAVAAYGMAILVVRFEAPLLLAAVGGLLAAVFLAIVMGAPALRLRADYLAIATVAGGEIVRCAIGGCANAPTVIAPTEPHAEGLAFDGTNLYWASMGSVLTCLSPACSSPSTLAMGQSQTIVEVAGLNQDDDVEIEVVAARQTAA